MKTILVPTDFSLNADNALYYAIDLAKRSHFKLLLLHAYQVNYPNPYVPLDYLVEEKGNALKDSDNQLKSTAQKISHAGHLEYEYLSVEDAPVDAILKIIKEKEIDLVVMGTKGDSNLANNIFGSNAAKVLEKATCPVMAIPQDSSFKDIKKFTYATAYNYSDVYALKKVVEMAKLFNAQVNVLHILDNSKSLDKEKELMKNFMDEVNRKIQYSNMSFQLLEGKNVEDALEEYIVSDSTSILVMSTHHRDFFDKLFGKSITKHMAYHTSIPLMAFHHDKKSSIKVY